MLKTFAAPLALVLSLVAGAGHAATVLERDVGDFSGEWNRPSAIGAGVSSVSGTWAFSNDYDILHFGVLPAGKQIITLVFEAFSGFGNSYSAGGQILFSTQAFRWSWDGTYVAGGGVNFGNYNAGTPIVRTIELGDDFGGQLWLGLYGTHSNPLSYTISTNAMAPAADLSPSVVPLPAGLALMLTALGGLGALALRRRLTARV